LDELFTALTLKQTGRMQVIPIILYGREYWERIVNFQALADEGVIEDDDLDLLQFADSPEHAWKIIADFHKHV
jgi:predicted Rossmann-fold nucleotide-binding protein